MNRACADEKTREGKVPSRRGGYLVAFFLPFRRYPFCGAPSPRACPRVTVVRKVGGSHTREGSGWMTTRIDQFSPPGGEVNTWIIGDDEAVIVIDPRADAGGRAQAVGEREVLAVICTHGHADHVTAAIEVAERDEAAVALHPRDRMLWRETAPGDAADIDMEDGGVFEVADVAARGPPHPRPHAGLRLPVLRGARRGVHRSRMLAEGPAAPDGDYPRLAGQLNSIGEPCSTAARGHPGPAGSGRRRPRSAAEKKFDSLGHGRPAISSPVRASATSTSDGAARLRRHAAAALHLHADSRLPLGWTARAGTG